MRRALPLLLVLAVLPGACRKEQAASSSFENAPVIVISVDTLRADRLPLYGYPKVATPHIDSLRADGILYENAYSHCPMTLPSHVSMLTGLLPTEHEVRNNLGYRFDAAKYPTLPQRLKERGYATGAAVSSYVLRAETGLGAAFDFYEDAIPVSTTGATSQHQRSGRATLAAAREWLSRQQSQPFFFLFHIYEPHAPYTPPEPFKSRYSDPYDGEVATADEITGEFLQLLKQAGIYDRAIIVLTSDHGEGLMQHGEDQHGILLYREVLHVPLIVKLPGRARAGDVVKAQAALADLPPTLLKATGAKIDKGVDILAAELPHQRRIYSETFYPRIHLGWSELRSLIDYRNHYIQGPKPELYDVFNDPAETTDILSEERRTAASMREELAKYPAGIQELQQIDPEDAAKLEALGYLGSVRATGAGAALPNPRDMLPYLERIKAAVRLKDERRYDEAVTALRGLVRENPGLADVWDELGELLFEIGEYEEAIKVYREAMSRSQRFLPETALSLGSAYLETGQYAEAERHADLAMKSAPSNAHALRARIAMRQRDFAKAEQEARLAIGTQNPQPATMLILADVKRQSGDLQGALAAADAAERRARELNVPALYRLDFIRADVYARLDRPGDALAAYRREIEHFPHNTQAYANLAIIYFLQGQRSEVERTLDAMVKANPHPGARALAARTRKEFQG